MNMMKHHSENDIAVIMLFFNRPEIFRRTFEAVKKSRPSHLFLFQDGARNDGDRERMEQCRRIVADEQIDWECDVQRCYSEKNLGVWEANWQAQQWGFSLFDKCVYLEDDSMPSPSFIPFCKEMLDRYEHDPRVMMVAGYNHEGITEGVPHDYLFTSVFTVWGWASWSKVVLKLDAELKVVDDPFNMRQIEEIVRARGDRSDLLKAMKAHHDNRTKDYEAALWSHILLNNGLSIVPTRNLIRNEGSDADAAHYQQEMQTLPRRMRQMLQMPSYELKWPLRHPEYMVENVEYKERVFRIMAWGHPWIKVGRSFEELFLNLRYGNFKAIATAVCKRINKLAGRSDYM